MCHLIHVNCSVLVPCMQLFAFWWAYPEVDIFVGTVNRLGRITLEGWGIAMNQQVHFDAVKAAFTKVRR